MRRQFLSLNSLTKFPLKKNSHLLIASIFFPLLANSAFAAPNKVVFFGDSASDAGYFAINPAIVGDDSSIRSSGVETLRPGLVWSESFGAKFGISTSSVDGDVSNSTTNGGNNYSASGSRINNPYLDDNIGSGGWNTGTWTTAQQVTRFLSDNNGVADSNTIYSFGSSNDLKFFSDQSVIGSGTNYIRSDAYSWADYGDVDDLVTDYTTQLLKVKNAGGQYFLVDKGLVSAPSQAIADIFNSADVIYDETAYNEISAYNSSLLSSLQSAGINVIWFDKENVLFDVVNNYESFGLTTTGMQNRACTLNGSQTYSYSIGEAYDYGTVECASDALTAYWSVDGQHLAPAIQNIIADAKYNLFVAPIQVSYLPETTFKTRWNMNGVVNSKIFNSFSKEDANNSWMSLDTASFNQKNQTTGYQGVTSNAYSLQVGHDYKLSKNYLVGGSLAASYSTNAFGGDRGDFIQEEKTASLYTAYNKKLLENKAKYQKHVFHTNAILSYGKISNQLNRIVPIGVTTQHLDGSTNSTNRSLELNASYTMTLPLSTSYDFSDHAPAAYFNHGPSARLLSQKATVDAFDETTSDEMSSIALGFNKQKTKSVIADIGYKFEISRKAWNYYIDPHALYELGDLSRKVYTRVISDAADPAYYLMTPEKDRVQANIITGVEFSPTKSLTSKLALQSFLNQDKTYTHILSLGLGYYF